MYKTDDIILYSVCLYIIYNVALLYFYFLSMYKVVERNAQEGTQYVSEPVKHVAVTFYKW